MTDTASPIDAVQPSIEEIENEGRTRAAAGWLGLVTNGLAIALSLYSLYWVVGIVQPQIYRVSFLLLSLVLIFLLFRGRKRSATVGLVDWLLAGTSIVALIWPIFDFAR